MPRVGTLHPDMIAMVVVAPLSGLYTLMKNLWQLSTVHLCALC